MHLQFGHTVELIKLFDDDVIDILLNLFNRIYDKGEIPKPSIKPNPGECSDYRTIALMGHTLKLFLKILRGNEQFGFHEESRKLTALRSSLNSGHLDFKASQRSVCYFASFDISSHEFSVASFLLKKFLISALRLQIKKKYYN